MAGHLARILIDWFLKCQLVAMRRYTSQAATRMLYNIARAGDVARRTIKQYGGVKSLLSIISTDRCAEQQHGLGCAVVGRESPWHFQNAASWVV